MGDKGEDGEGGKDYLLSNLDANLTIQLLVSYICVHACGSWWVPCLCRGRLISGSPSLEGAWFSAALQPEFARVTQTYLEYLHGCIRLHYTRGLSSFIMSLFPVINFNLCFSPHESSVYPYTKNTVMVIISSVPDFQQLACTGFTAAVLH